MAERSRVQGCYVATGRRSGKGRGTEVPKRSLRRSGRFGMGRVARGIKGGAKSLTLSEPLHKVCFSEIGLTAGILGRNSRNSIYASHH